METKHKEAEGEAQHAQRRLKEVAQELSQLSEKCSQLEDLNHVQECSLKVRGVKSPNGGVNRLY
jgi:predicted nuclease with TOPRIM domain